MIFQNSTVCSWVLINSSIEHVTISQTISKPNFETYNSFHVRLENKNSTNCLTFEIIKSRKVNNKKRSIIAGCNRRKTFTSNHRIIIWDTRLANNERVSRKETLVQTQSNLLENKPIGYFSNQRRKILSTFVIDLWFPTQCALRLKNNSKCLVFIRVTFAIPPLL